MQAKIKFNYLAYYWCWLAVPALIAGLYFWVAYKIKNSDKPKVVRRMLKLKMTTLFLGEPVLLLRPGWGLREGGACPLCACAGA